MLHSSRWAIPFWLKLENRYSYQVIKYSPQCQKPTAVEKNWKTVSAEIDLEVEKGKKEKLEKRERKLLPNKIRQLGL